MNIDTRGAAADFRMLAEQVERAHPLDEFQCEFRLEDLHDREELNSLIRHVASWEKETSKARYLYSFTLNDANLGMRCREAVARTKTPGRNIDERKFSRVNVAVVNSCCLYVGSSKSLSARLREHLGLANRATYAMQMTHWQSEQALAGRVYFEATRFSPEIEPAVLQAIEDKLWQTEQPLLGRMGAR